MKGGRHRLLFCIVSKGLTYWLNGTSGYNCLGFKVVTSACLSASNALTFVHLFVFSNSLWAHQTSNRYVE